MSESKEITTISDNNIAISDNDLAVQDMEEEELSDSVLEHIGELCGSKSKSFGLAIMNQLGGACGVRQDGDDVLLSVLENIKGIAPKDTIEGLLAIQMIATHYAAMNSLGRATQRSEIRHENINAANKLIRSFTMQMEALNRYRGKGQQKVTVEHVHVHSGGQAIVGTVTPTKSAKQGGFHV